MIAGAVVQRLRFRRLHSVPLLVVYDLSPATIRLSLFNHSRCLLGCYQCTGTINIVVSATQAKQITDDHMDNITVLAPNRLKSAVKYKPVHSVRHFDKESRRLPGWLRIMQVNPFLR